MVVALTANATVSTILTIRATVVVSPISIAPTVIRDIERLSTAVAAISRGAVELRANVLIAVEVADTSNAVVAEGVFAVPPIPL